MQNPRPLAEKKRAEMKWNGNSRKLRELVLALLCFLSFWVTVLHPVSSGSAEFMSCGRRCKIQWRESSLHSWICLLWFILTTNGASLVSFQDRCSCKTHCGHISGQAFGPNSCQVHHAVLALPYWVCLYLHTVVKESGSPKIAGTCLDWFSLALGKIIYFEELAEEMTDESDGQDNHHHRGKLKTCR